MSLTTHQPSPHVAHSSFVNWDYLVTIVLRRLWLFLLCFFCVVAAAIAYIIKAPRLYESTAVVQVEQQEQRSYKPNGADAEPESLRDEDILKTIEQNLQSDSLFLSVISSPDVANDPHFLVGYTGQEQPPTPESLAGWVKENTTVVLRHGTRLIDIRVDHQVPEMAKKLAQSMVTQYMLGAGQARISTEQAASQFLVEESTQIKASLQKSEDSLQIYKESLLIKDRIEDQQRVIDALRQRYREKHPQLVQARTLMGDLLSSFDQEFKRIQSSSTSEASYWASNKEALAAGSADNRILTELRLVEARSNVLQREVDTESALFDNVLKQMREADVSKASSATQIQLVEAPATPLKPAKPRKLLILVIAIAAGLVLGTGAIVLMNAIESSIQTAVEVEALFGLPVLGMISFFSAKKPRPLARSGAVREDTWTGIVVVSDPGGSAAEDFRSMRAAISLLGKTEDCRSVLFASARANEGKTLISCNYALSLAQADLKTLLVDADLRRPSVHTNFSIPNKNGFAEVAAGQLELKDATHHNVAKNLDILTAGGRAINPAELLSGLGMSFLEQALRTYDRVVFDSSPVNFVSDSLLIAPYVQKVFLVVRSGGTSRRQVQQALTSLRRAKNEASGVILNFVPTWTQLLTQPAYRFKGTKAADYRRIYSKGVVRENPGVANPSART